MRFGHFEHFAHHGHPEALRAARPTSSSSTTTRRARGAGSPYAALLGEVARRTAGLIADWQAVGFCHGVMNTDNMSVLGLTIDYGPFGFLDAFDPGHVCNHSDHQGRYAYARQPNVAFWNLHALAQALMPLLADGAGGEEQARRARHRGARPLPRDLPAALAARCAPSSAWPSRASGDGALVDDLLRLMAAHRADFTITFRRLADFSHRAGRGERAGARPVPRPRGLRRLGAALRRAAARRGQRRRRAARRACAASTRACVLRNHLAETAIRRAGQGDFSEVERLHRVLSRPFDDPDEPTPADRADADFPPAWAQSIEVSCSS